MTWGKAEYIKRLDFSLSFTCLLVFPWKESQTLGQKTVENSNISSPQLFSHGFPQSRWSVSEHAPDWSPNPSEVSWDESGKKFKNHYINLFTIRKVLWKRNATNIWRKLKIMTKVEDLTVIIIKKIPKQL